MGRIIDFIRNNVFWVLLALALVALGVVYVFVGRGLAEAVASQRSDRTRVMKDLERWSGRDAIANPRMIDAAEAEEQLVKTLRGQMLAAFAPRSGLFARDLIDIAPKEISQSEMYEWWAEYETRTAGLISRTTAWFDAPNNVMTFRPRSTPVKREPQLVEREQARYWRLELVAQTLRYASPENKPLIEQVQSIKLGNVVSTGDAWTRARQVTIRAVMRYEKIGELVAALHNAPKPLLVDEATMTRRPAGPEAAVAGARGKQPPSFDVILKCRILEFLPVIRQVRFGGDAFASARAVETWLYEEGRNLEIATGVLLRRVPGFARRAEAWLGRPVEEARREAQAASDERLAEIAAEAAAELEKMLEEAKEDGEVPPPKREAIEAAHKRRVTRLKEEAEGEYRRALFGIAARSGGFALVYDHLRSFVPRKAYFIGLEATERDYAIIRSPDRAGRAGRWWLVGREGGTEYGAKDDVSPEKRRAEILGELIGGNREAQCLVDARLGAGPALHVDPKTGEVVQALIAAAGGGWSTYPALVVEGEAVSLSDAAFRFAPVLYAAAEGLGTPRFKRAAKTIDVLPADAVAGVETFTIVLPAKGGEIEVVAGLRK